MLMQMFLYRVYIVKMSCAQIFALLLMGQLVVLFLVGQSEYLMFTVYARNDIWFSVHLTWQTNYVRACSEGFRRRNIAIVNT